MPAGMGAQRRRRLLLAACCCCCCCLLAARRAQGFLLLPPSAPRTRSLEAAGGGGGPGKVQEFREQEQQEAAAAPLACSRKAFFALAAGLWVALPPAQSFAEALTEGGKVQLTKADIEVAKQAFALFDKRQLGLAEKVFTDAISRWEKTDRPKDEVISLIKARGNVRVDIKKFSAAIEDYDLVVAMMQADGAERPEDGTSRYGEYPDTFVQRGLAREGLADWEGAIEDYSKAVKLWGGGRGEGINPYVLTFRANALGRLQRYADALLDYEAAEKLFTLQKDADRALDARANTALVLFQVGRKNEARKLMNDIIRKQPGYADMRVALAAIQFNEGDAQAAEANWQFTCDKISVGCTQYKDMQWVRGIRRWPPTLADLLEQFLNERVPAALSKYASTS